MKSSNARFLKKSLPTKEQALEAVGGLVGEGRFLDREHFPKPKFIQGADYFIKSLVASLTF